MSSNPLKVCKSTSGDSSGANRLHEPRMTGDFGPNCVSGFGQTSFDEMQRIEHAMEFGAQKKTLNNATGQVTVEDKADRNNESLDFSNLFKR